MLIFRNSKNLLFLKKWGDQQRPSKQAGTKLLVDKQSKSRQERAWTQCPDIILPTFFPCSGSTFLVYSSVSSFVSFQNTFNAVYIQAEITNVHRICSYTQSWTNSCITHMTYYSENPHLDALKPRWLGNSLLSENTGKKRGKECRKSTLPKMHHSYLLAWETSGFSFKMPQEAFGAATALWRDGSQSSL